jgi:hypothetical protein
MVNGGRMSAIDYWIFFADDAKRTGSPLYSRISAGIGQDEELKALCAHARPGQPHANMILGAVHFLLLRGNDHRLKRFYQTVGGTSSAQTDDPFPDFRDFVYLHRDAVLTLIETRVTNTNEIGRSALLHAAFRAVAYDTSDALSLIEIGPSAGLNLIWDSYGVRYLRSGVAAATVNDVASLMIDCELRGERTPPVAVLPSIAGRVGLELHPVDLSKADDRDWLRALIWPDQTARLARLDRAIELFMVRGPVIRAGDALDLLPEALAEVPSHQVPCVYHTIAIYQFSREMKRALEDLLVVAGLRRPVRRISFEFDGELYILSAIRYADGLREEKRLASCHPHGTWLEWLA